MTPEIALKEFLAGGISGVVIEELVSCNSNGTLLNLPFRPVYGFGALVLAFYRDKQIPDWTKVLLSTLTLAGLEELAGHVSAVIGGPQWSYQNSITRYVSVGSLCGFFLASLAFNKHGLSELRPEVWICILFLQLYLERTRDQEWRRRVCRQCSTI